MSSDTVELIGRVGTVRYPAGPGGQVGVVFGKFYRGGFGKSLTGASGTIKGVALFFPPSALQPVREPGAKANGPQRATGKRQRAASAAR